MYDENIGATHADKRPGFVLAVLELALLVPPKRRLQLFSHPGAEVATGVHSEQDQGSIHPVPPGSASDRRKHKPTRARRRNP